MEDVSRVPEQNDGELRISALRKKIDDEDYLYEAIQRIALVLSNEISGVSGGKEANERKGR
jgi:hypothetical protein